MGRGKRKGLLGILRWKTPPPEERTGLSNSDRRNILVMVAVALFALPFIYIWAAKDAAEDRNAWLGRTRAEVQTAYGAPAETAPDGKGGMMLRYTFPCKRPDVCMNALHYRVFLVNNQGVVYQTY